MTYLLYLRKSRGWTLAQAAKATKVNQTLLSFAERGEYPSPRRKMLERIQAVYGKAWTWEALMKPIEVVFPPEVARAS